MKRERKPPVEVRSGKEWFRVTRYQVEHSGWLTWSKGDMTGLAQPKNWRYAGQRKTEEHKP